MFSTFRISFIFILFFLPPLYAKSNARLRLSAKSNGQSLTTNSNERPRFTVVESSDFVADVEARMNASQKHLIRGVYHLINQNDLDAAESEFRKAIALDQHNGEAYYFLGRVYYEQATSTGDVSVPHLQQSIGKAKALLSRAQELGITYDKLHPDLLSQLKKEYPKVEPIYAKQLFPKKTTIIIETEEPTVEIRILKINARDAKTKINENIAADEKIEPIFLGTFQPDEEIQLEGGASYQAELAASKPQGIKHLILVGIGLAIWFIR